MLMQNFSCEERDKRNRGLDITAVDEESNEKVLLRIVKSKSKSGYVGVDAVRKMLEAMEHNDYDKGVIFGKKFTVAAKRELLQNDIKRVSETHTLKFKPEKLYLQINQYIDDLCEAKCGKIPKKESDCRCDCRIRVISDNASFHFDQGWTDLLKNDFKQLFAIRGSKDHN